MAYKVIIKILQGSAVTLQISCSVQHVPKIMKVGWQ